MPDTLEMRIPTSERTTPEQDVALFLDKVMSLPLREWVAAATAEPLHADPHAAAHLASVLERVELLYAAWLIRDEVETACCRFDAAAGRRAWTPARIRDVRRATERAALALLARPSLGPTSSRRSTVASSEYSRSTMDAHRHDLSRVIRHSRHPLPRGTTE